MSLARAHILSRQQEALLAENTRLREAIRKACQEPRGLYGEPAVTPSQDTVPHAQIKTKMCKFHILGQCAKGEQCLFAHNKEELNPLPDLRCTKLCRTLLKIGRCDAVDCTYAHSKEELRQLGKIPGNRQDVFNTEAAPMKVVPKKIETSKALDLSPAYVILPCEQPASWELPLPFQKISCPPAFKNPAGISIDQSKGDVQISEANLYTPFGEQADIFRPLRSVRTSETTLCTLTDRL